jgi:hypothetical protein
MISRSSRDLARVHPHVGSLQIHQPSPASWRSEYLAAVPRDFCRGEFCAFLMIGGQPLPPSPDATRSTPHDLPGLPSLGTITNSPPADGATGYAATKLS